MEEKKETQEKETFKILLSILVLTLIAGCAKSNPESLVGGGTPIPPEASVQSGQIKEFKMTAKQFAFEPGVIEVNKGDKVRLIVTSIDVPHGIGIPEYGINERLDPGKPVTIEFIADKEGTFITFCTVLCGSGHSNMKGKIIVK